MHRLVLLFVPVVVVAACSGGSSSDVRDVPDMSTTVPLPPTSIGPAATTTTEIVTTTTVPSPVEVTDLTSWTRIADEIGVFGPGSWVEAAVYVADGFVAVGPSGAWRSGDGRVWEAAEIDLPFGANVADVVDGPLGLVAVGEVLNEPDGRRNPAVWVSEDGLSWERRVADGAVSGRDSAGMEGVVYWDSMLVAVGNSCLGEPGSCPSAPTVWVSSDAVSWELTTVMEGFGGMNDVAAVGDRLVSVGALWDEDDPDGAIWVSRDGITWDQVAVTLNDELNFGDEGDSNGSQWLSQIASLDEVIVAVGASYDFESQKAYPRFISSVECPNLDSATSLEEGFYCWTSFIPEDIDYPEAVAALDSGFIVAGYQATDPPSGSVWISEDADSWHLATADTPMADATLKAIAASPQAVIVTGISYTDTPVWVAP